MTPAQCVEARRLLNWTQRQLAKAAGVPQSLVGRFERVGVIPKARSGLDRHDAMRTALEVAGVEFSDGCSPGVKLWKSAPVEAAEGGALTSEQCIEARHLLGLTQRALAKTVRLSQSHISLFEQTGHMPRPEHGRRDRLADLKAALEQAGVEFVDENGGQPGVRLRKPEPGAA